MHDVRLRETGMPVTSPHSEQWKSSSSSPWPVNPCISNVNFLLFSSRFNFRTFRWMQTMIFAIEEINRKGNLLPNITLGYKIYDSCSTPHQALKAVLELRGTENNSAGNTHQQGVCHESIPAVIGDGGSTQSLVVAHFLGVFHVPQVGFSQLVKYSVIDIVVCIAYCLFFLELPLG